MKAQKTYRQLLYGNIKTMLSIVLSKYKKHILNCFFKIRNVGIVNCSINVKKNTNILSIVVLLKYKKLYLIAKIL